MLSVFKYVCDFAVSDSSVILPPHVGFECDNVVSSGRPRSRVKACLALETGQTLPSVGQPQHYTPRCSPPPHFWSVTLIITYQHKHLPNYLRPGGVFCVSLPCRHLPGFSGCGGDDMKRARRLCVCVCAARPLDVRLHLQFVAHLQCSDMWGPKQIMPPLTFSCSCLTSSFGSRSHESCRHRTQCPLLSLLRDTSRLLWQGFVSHGRKGPKDNNGHSVT